jgi:hypothetical protein
MIDEDRGPHELVPVRGSDRDRHNDNAQHGVGNGLLDEVTDERLRRERIANLTVAVVAVRTD